MFKAGDIIERYIERGGPNAGEQVVYYVLDGTPVMKWDDKRVATLPVFHPPHYFAGTFYDPDDTTMCSHPIYPAIHGSRLITGPVASHWRKVGESILIRLRLEGRWSWTGRVLGGKWTA